MQIVVRVDKNIADVLIWQYANTTLSDNNLDVTWRLPCSHLHDTTAVKKTKGGMPTIVDTPPC